MPPSWKRLRSATLGQAMTIGFEKRWNPLLEMDSDASVRVLTADIPAHPANMDQIVAFNIVA